MKRVGRLLFPLSILIFLFLSCEKGSRNGGLEDWQGEENSSVSNGNYFYHDLQDLIVNEDGQKLEVSIRTNGKWEISADISWIKLSKSSGKGNAIVSMQIQDNSTYESRKGKISIINLSRNQRFENCVEQTGRNRSLNGHEYVDLGMTDSNGTPIYWATCNIGAASPKELGDFFAWGETTGFSSGKKVFSWDTYKWKPVYDYNEQEYIIKDHLDSSDDAATVNWSGKWRMPKYYELHML